MTRITDSRPVVLDLDLILKGTSRLVEICDCRLDLSRLPPGHISPHFFDPKERLPRLSVAAIRLGLARWR
jgi:hypothetical protein